MIKNTIIFKLIDLIFISFSIHFNSGTIPIIGVGGISNGDDAYEKIKNGACLVQLYTALIYNGPTLVSQINSRLEELLREDGYSSIVDAVGADLKKASS